MSVNKVLIYGYGNPGRQDDALGIVMADRIRAWIEEHVHNSLEVDQNYQLNIEDADKIRDYDLVVFVDASVKDIQDFELEEVTPTLTTEFSMHSVSPAFVLGLCNEISDTCPKVFQLHIKGYEFEFMKEMSNRAKTNLDGAEKYLKSFIRKNMNS